MKYSMLSNDGRNNYQSDWRTVEGAISYSERMGYEWFVIVEVSTGKVAYNKSKDIFNINMEVENG